jgi:hypothetical protein
MNDTTVTVLVAVLGVVAGFITAFFAEPVKIHYQNRARIDNLRIGLYKEMYHNYVVCKLHYQSLKAEIESSREMIDEYKLIAVDNDIALIRSELRHECYQQVLKNEPFLFYQLPEATHINFTENEISRFLDLLNSDLTIDGSLASLEEFKMMCYRYATDFAGAIYMNKLDKRVIKKSIKKDAYDNLINVAINGIQ